MIYTDYNTDNGFVRIFESNINDLDLVWHRDMQDRIVEVIEGNNWQLQYDDQLPFRLVDDERYYIEAYSYHRLIKGDGSLTLRIVEL